METKGINAVMLWPIDFATSNSVQMNWRKIERKGKDLN